MFVPTVVGFVAALAGSAAACNLANSMKTAPKTPETRKQLCIPQGEGDWTFSMDVGVTVLPDFSTENPLAGLVGSKFFVIYDNYCVPRGVYAPSGNECGKPYVIEDNFLPYVLTVTDISWDLGDPYFRFKYADGLYSINNNHCTCSSMSHGIKGEQGCRCAFPISGQHPADPPPPPNGGGEPPKAKPSKYMFVGDSITHGYAGDYTWRYRLWQWFKAKAADIPLDFVGPYTGTQNPPPALPPQPPRIVGEPEPKHEVNNGPYATAVDPAFDHDHFAVWGRAAAQDKSEIFDQVKKYQPEMLLIALGFNDMGWFYSDDVGTLESMKTMIDQARAAKPDIKFAIANVPQRSFIGGRQDLVDKTTRYNAALKPALREWSTPESQIEHVDFAGHYDCQPSGCPSGYDGLHPNIIGEYQIAQAFAETLHTKFGIGSGGLDMPQSFPIQSVDVPAHIKAEGVATGVAVTWDPILGAKGYDVRSRVQGAADWTESRTSTNRFDTTLTFAGVAWEYQIRTSAGDNAKGQWSGTVSAVARRDTAPAPETIKVTPTSSGLDINWSSVAGVDEYEVIIWDKDTPGAFIDSRGTRDTHISISGLNAGHVYAVWVACWNNLGGGLPGEARPGRVGTQVPSAPTDLRVVNKDVTTVELSWAPSNAAAYQIYMRNIHNGPEFTKDNGTEMTTSHGVAFLFPGTWNFEFCVGGVNGDLMSVGTSNCVIPPKMSGY